MIPVRLNLKYGICCKEIAPLRFFVNNQPSEIEDWGEIKCDKGHFLFHKKEDLSESVKKYTITEKDAEDVSKFLHMHIGGNCHEYCSN